MRVHSTVRINPVARMARVIPRAGPAEGNDTDNKVISLFAASPLQFGPRLVAGALATALEEGINAPLRDIERMQMILNSDADGNTKQEQLLSDVENRIAGFVSLGTEKENEVIKSLKQSVPEEVQASLPDSVREFLFPATEDVFRGVGSNGSKQVATWTISDIDEYSDDDGLEQEYVTPEATAMGQAASELSEIQGSVVLLKKNVEALKSNTDVSKAGILKLNVRDAAKNVEQKLDQRTGSTRNSDNPDVDSALAEARSLLKEVEDL